MMQRIALASFLLAVACGCSAVVNNTLEMKGDGGPSGCSIDDDCTDGNPCNGIERCVANDCRNEDSMPDGTPCATPAFDGMCREAMCVPEEGCGDGILQEGPPFNEECDDGANPDPDDGCRPDCQYSCHDDIECDDLFECNGAEVCSIPSGSNNTRRCQPEGALPPPMSACDVGLGDNQRCLMAPTGQLFCCQFNDGMMPIECCRPEGPPGEFTCGAPPMP